MNHKMLFTNDIWHILSTDKRTKLSFRGVYASDQLPHNVPTSSLYVCNTDPSTRGGEHWVAMYVDVKRRGELFDSGGDLSPINSEFVDFLTANCNTWTYNVRAVQHPLSDACGYHVIFFSVYRCLGYSLDDILRMYTSSNLNYNDSIVKEFVRAL